MGWVHSYGTGVDCWQCSLVSSASKATEVSCSIAVVGNLFQFPMDRKAKDCLIAVDNEPLARNLYLWCDRVLAFAFSSPMMSDVTQTWPLTILNIRTSLRSVTHKILTRSYSGKRLRGLWLQIFIIYSRRSGFSNKLHHGRDTGCGVIITLNKACCFSLDFLKAVYILDKIRMPYSSSILQYRSN